MENSKKSITDISGRNLHTGDQVFILDVLNPNLDISHIISSLTIGKIISAQEKNNILVEIEGIIFSCPANKLSKIYPEENIDDIIIHVSHDVETLQLNKESEILNDMLCIEDKKGRKI
jgi:hypothetical protein